MIKLLAAAGLVTMASWASAAAPAAAPNAAQVKAAHDLLVSMQAEKMIRLKAGSSKYADDKQRLAVLAKVERVTPQEIYRRLSVPVAQLVTAETAGEMTRFYMSSYGQRVLKQTYNGGPSLYAGDPEPTKDEKLELKRPAYLKAEQEFKAARPAIQHAAFVLVTEIARK